MTPSAPLKNPQAAELYSLAQQAGMPLPEPGINPAQAFFAGAFSKTGLEIEGQAFTNRHACLGVMTLGMTAALEVTGCVWGLETGLRSGPPSEIFAAGVWALNFWRAAQAADRIRPFVVAHALAAYAASLEAPAEYFDPWAGAEATPAALSGAQLGDMVPNTVEAELADLVAEKAKDIESYLARALSHGLGANANDLHEAANPQSSAADAGGEYGDAVAIAAIKLAAAHLLADQEPFIAALNRIKADKLAEAERAKAPDPLLTWFEESQAQSTP